MSGFGMSFATVICLLVFPNRTRLSAFLATDPLPNKFKRSLLSGLSECPSANVTAKKFMTNFLRIPYWTSSPQRLSKRNAPGEIEDTVVVVDGSGSVAACEFEKGKKALKYMMAKMHNPSLVDANSAQVNFKFLPYSTAATDILNIPYPGGGTNTQAGLAEAKNLFDDPSSDLLNDSNRKFTAQSSDRDEASGDFKMSGFGMSFASVICLLVFLTGRGSAGQPSYPTNPNDPYYQAASEILKIPYPSGSTNTHAGLAEAKKLFDYVPFSGGRLIYTRTVLLVTDGQSNVQTHLTIPMPKH
ncbi:hypothetical protein OS493_018819 [Desmophyllum pertusum]|uniref:VWFA domain-containing protein n=1 Tax=Desmophyllum pertusum TaxID=174260 RepID=A0A9W9ZCP7_9CNID|nr:hypothetical protein OS493_018819 [Desmophyllum pertusum]